MAVDCKAFSSKAEEIFGKLEPYFPPDPWGKPRWIYGGKVFDNGWYNLCKSKDRMKMIRLKRSLAGYIAEVEAAYYRGRKGSLSGFTRQRFTPLVQNTLELLLLLQDLDFQIETSDFVDS